MRIPRVYVALPLTAGVDISLPEAQAHYLTRVLRMEAGRPLIVFNGEGGSHNAEIITAGKNNCVIRLVDFTADNHQSPLNCSLAIGISKGERFEFVLQKACELGVTQIYPLFTQRTEVRLDATRQSKKTEHWLQVLISSCEQNGRNLLPQLRAPQTLSEFLPTVAADLKLVLHHRANQALNSYSTPHSVCLLIGPEGGLSEDEIKLAEQQGFNPLVLGPRILRTETAPLVALSLVQYQWGDLR
ncbi:MAG TPA: 16S rRNA (uracil(1498)-N(3))-methyltransferase [Cellvibrionaceae bacterium]|nr:16S rRNA (uracil(1498)-N(3))-methyltransferase [Cellvibrionaceae bacterium]HMW71507.1 16S rRNA (uracil(1498)-N(3))-methyltransferase [Cellvibrionaceae bacterium]HNG59498.1 16S rRNA (uracil(1498)-N(3))-methyltransferase [Cellvibrionaceae bacterium]